MACLNKKYQIKALLSKYGKSLRPVDVRVSAPITTPPSNSHTKIVLVGGEAASGIAGRNHWKQLHHLSDIEGMTSLFLSINTSYLPLIKSKYSNLLLKFVPVDTACSGFMTSSARYGPQHRWWYSDMTKTWFTLDLPIILHSWSFIIWWNPTFSGAANSPLFLQQNVYNLWGAKPIASWKNSLWFLKETHRLSVAESRLRTAIFHVTNKLLCLWPSANENRSTCCRTTIHQIQIQPSQKTSASIESEGS